MRKKKAGLVLAAAGVVLIALALLLLFHNRKEDRRAGEQSQAVLEEMHRIQDDGGATLPVGSLPPVEWDYDRLLIAPCRQFGTTQTNDLVIAAHNYTRHFGLLYELSPGDAVIFTAPDGARIDYAVAEVRTLAPDEVEAVQNSGHALTLYTCTSGGVARTAVFCDRATAGKK